MKDMLKDLVSTGHLADSESVMFQKLLDEKKLSCSDWISTQIRIELLYCSFSREIQKESSTPKKKISLLEKKEFGTGGNPTIYADESVEDIVFLIEFLDEKYKGTSTFFKNCKSRLLQKKSISDPQIGKLIEATWKYIDIVKSTPALSVGFNELQRKLEIDYDATCPEGNFGSNEMY